MGFKDIHLFVLLLSMKGENVPQSKVASIATSKITLAQSQYDDCFISLFTQKKKGN